MSILTLIMIVLMAIAVVFGTLWGLKRGLKHSILRLILIIGCAVGAILLHQALADAIMEFKIGEETLAQMFIGEVASEEELTMNVLFVGFMVKIISYLIIFGLLRFLSWLIVFPILKFFIKKDLIKKRLLGMLVGFIQGLVIAFVVLVPLHGMFVNLNEGAKIPMKSNVASDIVKDLSVEEYVNSGIGGIFDSIGGWYFEIIMEQK